MIWPDTDIRLIVNITAQSVIRANTDIRLIVKTTAQSVIWADTDIRLIVKTTAQSVIWADTDIRLIDCVYRNCVASCKMFLCTDSSQTFM